MYLSMAIKLVTNCKSSPWVSKDKIILQFLIVKYFDVLGKREFVARSVFAKISSFSSL